MHLPGMARGKCREAGIISEGGKWGRETAERSRTGLVGSPGTNQFRGTQAKEASSQKKRRSAEELVQ